MVADDTDQILVVRLVDPVLVASAQTSRPYLEDVPAHLWLVCFEWQSVCLCWRRRAVELEMVVG